MREQAEYIDPSDVAGVNERIRAWDAGAGTVRPVTIRRIVIAEDAIDALVEQARALGGGGRTMLVLDRTPMLRGGVDVKATIEERLQGAGDVVVRRLPDDEAQRFSADMVWAERLAGEVRSCAVVVSVGSGSVTDVAKYARHLATGADDSPAVPMVSFPTAASVTAYTSALAVLLVDGVKRTLAARAPDAVVCDLKTLADAPKLMTLAGFGDMLARAVAYGDWFLAGQLGMDDGFNLVPGRLLAHAERAMTERAEQVAAGELEAVRCLIEGLLLAGMAMSIVNQTAPVSGWEHVLSHYLDLVAHAGGGEPALHGAQVGVASLVAARAYERCWPVLDLDCVLRDADMDAEHRRIEQEFAPLDPTGRLQREIWSDLEKKLNRWNRSAQPRRAFVERKRAGEFDEFLRTNVRPSGEVANALARATAPSRFEDLTPPIATVTARQAVLSSHLIRARFTLGDLLSRAGWLADDTAAALLDEPTPQPHR